MLNVVCNKEYQEKCAKIDSTLVLYDNVIYAVYLGINYQKYVVKFGHLKLFLLIFFFQ